MTFVFNVEQDISREQSEQVRYSVQCEKKKLFLSIHVLFCLSYK